uniref:Proline-rich transmembrane protein 2 n=1 Tax=Cynoglossus semilaevis TaxID=244447 RepID=A0A3P8WJJ5_CYNSE
RTHSSSSSHPLSALESGSALHLHPHHFCSCSCFDTTKAQRLVWSGLRTTPHGDSCTRKGSRASSIGYTAFSPRPSISRHSSIATNPPLDRSNVKDYLLLSVLACFCPVWPINIVGFVYSIMVRGFSSQGNLDGAVRLGRVAKMLSMVSLVGGSLIIIACIVNLASECPKSDL